MTIPTGADAGEIGKLLERAGRGRHRDASSSSTPPSRAPRQAAPRPLHAAEGHDQRRRDRGADEGPEGRRWSRPSSSRSPRARRARENAPLVDKGPVEGSYLKAADATRRSCAARARSARPRHQERRGLPVPGDLHADRRRDAPSDLVERAARRVRGELRQGRHELRQAKNLTRYDVLIIASMIEREAQLATERPLVAAVIYNRLQARACRSGSTPRSATTIEQLAAADPQSPSSSSDTPYNTRTAPRAAADADRQPRPRVDQGRRQPRARRSTCSTCASPASPASTRSRRTDAQFERDVARYQASPRRSLDDLPRRLRLAGGPLALAADAQRGARRPSASTTGATSGCRCRRSCSPRPCARCRRAGFRGVNVTIPHKEAALALADRREPRPRGRSAPPTRSRSRTARSTPTTPTRRASSRALDALRLRRARRWCSAPAAPPAPRSRRCAQAGAARCAVWNRTPERAARARRASSARVRAERRAGRHRRQLHVGRALEPRR